MPWVEPIARRAAWVTIAAITVAFLALAKSFVIPIALALLFSFLLTPVVGALHRWLKSRVLAVVISCGVAFSVVFGAGYVVTMQLVDFADQLPGYKHTIAQKIVSLRSSGQGVLSRLLNTYHDINKEVASSEKKAQNATSKPAEAAATTETTAAPAPAGTAGTSASTSPITLDNFTTYISPLLEPLTLFFIVCILVVLLLVNGEDLRDRVIVLAGTQQISITTQALEEASAKIGRYLLMQAIVNTTFGIVISTGLYLIGIPNAVLLGLLAGAMRFIPVVGVWCAALLPAALAIAVFDHWSPLLYVGLLFACSEAIMNFVAEPLLYGLSTGISGVAVLVAILFWTWVWGPLGLLLAVPITVCLVVLGKHLEPLRVFYIILGDEPVLAGQTRLYHRLVAGDVVSVEQIVKAATLELGEARVCDDLLFPVLQIARQDCERGQLSEDRCLLINETLTTLGSALPSLTTPATGAIACVGAQKDDTAATQILTHALQAATEEAVIILESSILSELVRHIEADGISVLVLVTTGRESLTRARLLAKGLIVRSPDCRVFVADLARLSRSYTQEEGAGTVVVLDTTAAIVDRVQQLVRERLPDSPAAELAKATAAAVAPAAK